MLKQQEANRLFLDGADDYEVARLLELPMSAVKKYRQRIETLDKVISLDKKRRRKRILVKSLTKQGFCPTQIRAIIG